MTKLIGTGPNQVPSNADLGTMAYQDYDVIAPILKGGRRNMIINGDMRIAQRGTSYTGPNGFALDRWRNSENTGGVTTLSQQSDGPYTKDGHFKYYLQINVDTVDTAMAPADYAGAFYKVEGYDFDCAGYGNSQAKTLTLSFWHAHSEPGIYSIAMRNDGGGSNRNYVLDYTQDVANVWQKTTITFPGDTSGTWTETNTPALSIFWTFCQGSQYATTTLNRWFNGTYYHASTNIINMMATQNAKFRLTGVQLELGKVATPFEHRSYGEELALCQRYFQIYRPNRENAVYTSYSNQFHMGQLTLQVQMRADPTASWYDGNMRFAQVGYNSVSATVTNTQGHNFITTGMERQAIHFVTNRAAGGSTPTGDSVYNSEGTTARFFLDAEI